MWRFKSSLFTRLLESEVWCLTLFPVYPQSLPLSLKFFTLLCILLYFVLFVVSFFNLLLICFYFVHWGVFNSLILFFLSRKTITIFFLICLVIFNGFLFLIHIILFLRHIIMYFSSNILTIIIYYFNICRFWEDRSNDHLFIPSQNYGGKFYMYTYTYIHTRIFVLELIFLGS